MKNIVLSIAVAGVLAGCGASMQPPHERLASTNAAIRSARELGADSDPQAQLHVKLASEQMEQARKLMNGGDNHRADLVLQRASSDAELAVQFTRERAAKTAELKAKENLQANPVTATGK